MTVRPFTLLVLLSFAFVPPAGAQDAIRIDREVGSLRELALEVGQNRLLILSEALQTVSVAEPRVADVKVIVPTQLLLTAKGVGTTDLTLWNKRGEPLVIALRVSRNLEGLRKQLKEFFPGETLQVSAAGELVILAGEVSDVRVPERAAEVAKLHADKVANLIKVRGNQQVQLEVKFAEVSRRGLRELSFNVFHRDPMGRYVTGLTGVPPEAFVGIPGTGGVRTPSVYSPGSASAFSLFFSGLPRFPFSAMVALLESSGLAKILAEPTLVAMSGQEAKFLAGGEFPIPYSQGLGAVSIQWKQFGIILKFTPTVIDESTIHLKLAAEVSDVDAGRGVVIGGFTVPGLTSRQSETTVRLGDGQSFAIAGLLSNQVRSSIDRVPFFGDLPILGMLFRSVEYRRDESELLVVVTTRLTKPLAPHEVPPLPTDEEMNDPSDVELFLFGSEDRGAPKRRAAGPEKRALRGGGGPGSEMGFIR